VTADFELLSGAAEIEMVLLQNGSDEAALEGGHYFVQGFAAGASGLGGVGFVQASFELEIWQAAGLDLGGGFEDQSALDDVAEFADVAGPMVGGEFLAGGA
jgi:hypothetical protein